VWQQKKEDVLNSKFEKKKCCTGTGSSKGQHLPKLSDDGFGVKER
jgi:hypothetical protein